MNWPFKFSDELRRKASWRLLLSLLSGQLAACSITILFLFGIHPGINAIGLGIFGYPVLLTYSLVLAAGTWIVGCWQPGFPNKLPLFVVVACSTIGAFLLAFDLIWDEPLFNLCVQRYRCSRFVHIFLFSFPGNLVAWLVFRHFNSDFGAPLWQFVLAIVAILMISVSAVFLPCFWPGQDSSRCELYYSDAPDKRDCSTLVPKSADATACEIETFFAERMKYERIVEVKPCSLQIHRNRNRFCTEYLPPAKLTSIQHVNLRFVDTRPESVRIKSSHNIGGETSRAFWVHSSSYEARAVELSQMIVVFERRENLSTIPSRLSFSRELEAAGVIEGEHYQETIWCTGETTYFPTYRQGLTLGFGSLEDANQLVALLHRYKEQTCK